MPITCDSFNFFATGKQEYSFRQNQHEIEIKMTFCTSVSKIF